MGLRVGDIRKDMTWLVGDKPAAPDIFLEDFCDISGDTPEVLSNRLRGWAKNHGIPSSHIPRMRRPKDKINYAVAVGNYAASKETLEEKIFRERHEKIIRMTVKAFPGRKAAVVWHRFGLGSGSPKSRKDISKATGVSSGQVSQIEFSAIRKLRYARSPLWRRLCSNLYWSLYSFSAVEKIESRAMCTPEL